jgi:hypothetical protein
MPAGRSEIIAGGILGAIALAAAFLVVTSLRRPDVLMFSPTTAEPREVGHELVGPITYTVDASAESWRFFDFSMGSMVERPGPLEWDLAFRRFNVIVNGGPGFAGKGGALEVDAAALEAVAQLPADGYEQNALGRDSVNPALQRWYDYGFTTHMLTPKPRVYAIRTADGRHAKLEIVSYYCPGALPGCLTFRYFYDGSGGRDFSGAGPPPPAPGP